MPVVDRQLPSLRLGSNAYNRSPKIREAQEDPERVFQAMPLSGWIVGLVAKRESPVAIPY